MGKDEGGAAGAPASGTVPDTDTFNLQNVVDAVVPTTDDLVDCISDADTSQYDALYYAAPATSMLEFRNYGNGTLPPTGWDMGDCTTSTIKAGFFTSFFGQNTYALGISPHIPANGIHLFYPKGKRIHQWQIPNAHDISGNLIYRGSNSTDFPWNVKKVMYNESFGTGVTVQMNRLTNYDGSQVPIKYYVTNSGYRVNQINAQNPTFEKDHPLPESSIGDYEYVDIQYSETGLTLWWGAFGRGNVQTGGKFYYSKCSLSTPFDLRTAGSWTTPIFVDTGIAEHYVSGGINWTVADNNLKFIIKRTEQTTGLKSATFDAVPPVGPLAVQDFNSNMLGLFWQTSTRNYWYGQNASGDLVRGNTNV